MSLQTLIQKSCFYLDPDLKCAVFSQGWLMALTSANIVASFRKCGIHPFNRQAIPLFMKLLQTAQSLVVHLSQKNHLLQKKMAVSQRLHQKTVLPK